MPKKYRFFFHYNKPHKKWSVHFRKKCYVVEHVNCTIPCESHIQNRQPFRIMRGFASGVQVVNDRATIY